MNLQKMKKIAVVATFLICFIAHFVYTTFPNFITSLFFPVNESIWEHVKMMVTSILIWQIVEYFLLNKFKISYNNFENATFIMCLLSIPIFLIIYYPIYISAGNNFILNIICLFITIYFVNIIGYIILNKPQNKSSKIGIIGIIILFIIFGILTYYPPRQNIFKDPVTNTYGILTK